MPVIRGLDNSRSGYYFFLDCRHLNFEGKFPFGPYQVKGIQAQTHVATVRSGKIVSMAICNQDLERPGHEPIDKFAKIPEHLVPLESFLCAYDLLAPDEFTPKCTELLKVLWPST